MSKQITTITFFKYKGFTDKLWAFFMMQLAHNKLSKIKGQQFYKLMGSGKGMGFNPLPDWSIYSIVQVWNNEANANHFFEDSDVISSYKNHTSEQWTLYMKSIKAHGLWGGSNPFEKNESLNSNNPHVAIITRATIKLSKLYTFWKYVPISQKPLENSKGLLYTKGIGEVPLTQMATFSLWNSMENAKAFAYSSKEHQIAIQKTRTLNWYKEELFSRFQPYKSIGTWQGKKRLTSL